MAAQHMDDDDGGSLLESLTLQLASMPTFENALDEHSAMNNIAYLKLRKALILSQPNHNRMAEAIKELLPLIPYAELLDDNIAIHVLVLLVECRMQLLHLDDCEPLILLLESILDQQLEVQEGFKDAPYTLGLPGQVGYGQGCSTRGLVNLYSTRLMLLKRDGRRAAIELAKWMMFYVQDATAEIKEDIQSNLPLISSMLSNPDISLPLQARIATAELFLLLGLTDAARSILVDLLSHENGSEAVLVNNLAVARAIGIQPQLALEGFLQSSLDDYSLACTLLWKGLHSEALAVLSDSLARQQDQEGHQLLLLRTAEALVGLFKEHAANHEAQKNEDSLLLLFRALDCLQRFLQQDLAPTWPDRDRIRQHALALISYVHLMLGDPASSLVAAEQGMGERSDASILQSLCTYAAFSLDSLGRPFEAIDVLKDARSRSSDVKEVTLGLASMTAREQGNGSEALRILKGIDEPRESALLASYLLMAEGRPDEALCEIRNFKG